MPLRVRVESTRSLPRNLADRFDTELLAAAKQSQRIVVNRARQNAPTKTGTLRRSITADEVTVANGSIIAAVGAGGSGAPYAKGVEYGTGIYSTAEGAPRRPIVIVPIHAKALAWPGRAMGAPGGQYRRLSGSLRTSVRRSLAAGSLRAADVFVFAKRVVQQGQRPRPFLRPALDDSTSEIIAAFGAAIRRALGGS